MGFVAGKRGVERFGRRVQNGRTTRHKAAGIEEPFQALGRAFGFYGVLAVQQEETLRLQMRDC